MFVECPKVIEFWSKLLEHIKSQVITTLSITPFTIIFGYTLTEINQQPINTILLVAKKYIFETSSQYQNLSLNVFVHRLSQVYAEHQLLSRLCNEEENFNKIWHKWLPQVVQ